MAKVIKFKSSDDDALPEEQRVIETTDTVDVVENLSVENLLMAIDQCDEVIASEIARRDEIIVKLDEIKASLNLSVSVPAKS